MTVHEVLVESRNRLARDGWCQVRGRHHELGGHCATVWINEVAGGNFCLLEFAALDELQKALGFRSLSEIWKWNDAPGRTKAEVLAAFDKAISATAPEPAVPDLSHVEEPVHV